MADFRTDLEYEQKITELYLKPFYYDKVYPGKYKIITDVGIQKKGIDVQLFNNGRTINIDNKCSIGFCVNQPRFKTFMIELLTPSQGFKLGWGISNSIDTDVLSLQTISKWVGPEYRSCPPVEVPGYIMELYMLNERMEDLKKLLYGILNPSGTLGSFLYSKAMQAYTYGKPVNLAPGIDVKICNTKERSIVLVISHDLHKSIAKNTLHITREGITNG